MNSGEPEFGTLLKYISHSRVGVGERARHKRRHLDHPKCLSLDIKPSRAFKYRAAETHFVKPIPGFTPARLFCRWSQLGHRGWVALDSKNRPPVALIESRKTIGPQRRLSLSGERYADWTKWKPLIEKPGKTQYLHDWLVGCGCDLYATSMRPLCTFMQP